MTRRLNVLYKCMKFRWNICNGYQVIEQTRFCDGQTDRPTDTQTQGEKQYVSRPLQGGDIISAFHWKYMSCTFFADFRKNYLLKLHDCKTITVERTMPSNKNNYWALSLENLSSGFHTRSVAHQCSQLVDTEVTGNILSLQWQIIVLTSLHGWAADLPLYYWHCKIRLSHDMLNCNLILLFSYIWKTIHEAISQMSCSKCTKNQY